VAISLASSGCDDPLKMRSGCADIGDTADYT